MSRPVVAIVGRPNVGKSTLFNALAGERISIVKDTPGVTRDRIYADVSWLDYNFTMIDTGGIEPEIRRRDTVTDERAGTDCYRHRRCYYFYLHSVEDIPVFLIRGDRPAIFDTVLIEHRADTIRRIRRSLLVDKKIRPVRRGDKTVADTVHRLIAKYRKPTILPRYLVDDRGIGIREIIILIRLLLDRDSEPLRIGVVKEKDRTEDRTLPHSLRSD